MELQNITKPTNSASSKFNYIIDMNNYLITKLTNNWAHLFLDASKTKSFSHSNEFNDMFRDLKDIFSDNDVYERKRNLLIKNGLDGTLLDMKIALLEQLFENFKEHSTKESLRALIEKDILILKSLGNVYSAFDMVMELLMYLDSLMVKKLPGNSIN